MLNHIIETYQEMICRDARGRAARGAGQTVELRAIHRLPDGDPVTSPTCHRIPRHRTSDREATGRLEGRQIWDARGRYPAHVHRVPHRHPQGGVGGAPGTYVSKPAALVEAANGGVMDNREGDRRYPTSG